MIGKQLRRLTSFLGRNPVVRKTAPLRTGLTVTPLESRDVPAPLTWSSGLNIPQTGGAVAALQTASGELVLGGPTTAAQYLSVTDPGYQVTGTPTHVPLDFARNSPGVAVLPSGYVLVYGGVQNGFATNAVTQYDPNTLTVTDGATNQTKALRAMNSPRAEFGAATDSTSHLSYAIGGIDNNGTPLASVEAYNPTTNTWVAEASLPQTLYGESAVSDGAGHLFTFGGVGADGTITGNVYEYTVASNSWSQVASLPAAMRDSSAVLGSNGKVYVIGGKTATGTTAAVESYSLAGNSWAVETALPQAVSSAAVTVDSLGRLEVLGGYDANGNPVSTIELSQKLTQPDAAPTFTSKPVTAVSVNTTYSYQVIATGNPQPTYALTSAPSGMTINANTGLISWTPTYTTEGVYTVSVTANSSLGSVTQTFNVSVVPPSPTGVTAGVGVLSWNPSPDPNVTSYEIFKGYVYHSPRGSGGGTNWLPYSSTTGTSISLPAGQYKVAAVNSAGVASGQSAAVSLAALSAPNLFTAMTLSGADTSSQTLAVGQTGQVYLIQEFGNPAPTFSLVNGPSGISVDPTSGLVTYTPVAADIGTHIVTFAASNIYGTSTYQFTYVVNALTPTLAVVSGTSTYDGTPHAATATAIGSDGVSTVAGSFTFTYNGDPNPPTDAGTYSVVATFTSTDPNYASGTATGTMVIQPANPSVMFAGGDPLPYDGNSHGITATAVGVDGVTSIAGSFTITYNGSTTPPSGPGLYTVEADFASNDPNYASTATFGTLEIDSTGTTPPTLTLADGSTTFDGNPHGDTATAIGTDGNTPVAGTFVVTYNGSVNVPTAAGTYAVVATFISSDLTYSNATVTSTLSISEATPTVTIATTALTYNGQARSGGVTVVGVDGVTPVNGTLEVTYNGSTTLPVNAGTYDVEATFTSSDPNYTSATGSFTLVINPAAVSVGYATGQWQFTYDGTPQSVVAGAWGVDGLTPVNGSFSYQYFDSVGNVLNGAPTNAGSYAFTATFISADPNYRSGDNLNGQIVINPAQATILYNGGPFTYNGGQQGGTVSAVGLDGVTPVTGSVLFIYYGTYPNTTPPTTAGTYTVNAYFQSSDPNYYSGGILSTLEIDKATPAFSSLTSPAVTLGATTVTLSGHIAAGTVAPSGDDVAVTFNGITQAVAINTTGNFTATFSLQGLSAGNYSVSYMFLGDATRFNAAATGSATVTIRTVPTIQSGPANLTVNAGATATFTASATAFPTPTVQWQLSTNGGTTYTNITGATNTTLTLNNVSASQNGYRYRAVFNNSAGSTTTTAATLTVQTAPTVTTNPTSQTVNAGANATFTAAATGNPTPTVQWQVSTNGGITFSNISGATSTTLTVSATTAAQNGYQYHAVFTNSVGTITTTAATLTVRSVPAISTNPANLTVNAGQSATLTVAATGNPVPTVQWQVSTNGGTTFTNMTGATSTTLTLNNVTAAMNGYRYRAVFTNSLGSATTTAATLTVQSPPTVTTNPANQSVTAGTTVTFTAASTGNPTPTVKWQVSIDGGLTFIDITGATSNTLTLTGVTLSMNGYRYRAIFTNVVGTATTTAATLTVR